MNDILREIESFFLFITKFETDFDKYFKTWTFFFFFLDDLSNGELRIDSESRFNCNIKTVNVKT